MNTKYIIALSLLFGLGLLSINAASNEAKQTRVYMIGFAVSYVDSTAYITGIQAMDSVFVEKKTKFLVGRQLFSTQFQTFLSERKHLQSPTCSVFFSEKKQKMEKMVSRLTSYYTKQDALRLNALEVNDFCFHTEPYTPPTREEIRAQKEAEKATRKAEKAKKKDEKLADKRKK